MATNATLMCSEDDSNNMKHQLLTEQYLLTPDQTKPITATQTMYLLVYAYSCSSTHIPNWIHVFLPTAPYSCSWPYITAICSCSFLYILTDGQLFLLTATYFCSHGEIFAIIATSSYSRPDILACLHIFVFVLLSALMESPLSPPTGTDWKWNTPDTKNSTTRSWCMWIRPHRDTLRY